MLKALEELEKQSYSTALEALVLFAESGNPRAQCNLADLYWLGSEVKCENNKAIELYLKVAKYPRTILVSVRLP